MCHSSVCGACGDARSDVFNGDCVGTFVVARVVPCVATGIVSYLMVNVWRLVCEGECSVERMVRLQHTLSGDRTT